ncbi:hypothetical protein MTO96_000585 [Rhipicephalus appendiculatus]
MGSPAPWGVPPFIGLPGDPGLMGVVSSYSQCPQFSFLGPPPEIGPGILPASVLSPNAPVKELLRFPNCVLYPPKPNMPPPATRERPPGCRTVFVGGLPESSTEELVREVFQHCGTITTVRMSKKNFCHIRFETEEQVDRAIALSGYRMKIRDQEEASHTGRLHVDFAQARDDQYEWECRQRALQREQRHRERLDRERLRPPSPPPVVHYSDHEAQQLTERLKGDETFQKGSASAYSVVGPWRVHQAQRRDSREFLSNEIKSAHLADVLDKRQEDEMDLSDEDEPSPAKAAKIFESGSDGDGSSGVGNLTTEDESSSATRLALQEECDSLRCQLEAYRNEAQLLKAEQEQRDQQLHLLQQALQGLQQQRARDLQDLEKLRSSKNGSTPSPEREPCSASGSRNEVTSSTQVAGIRITEKDAKLIGLVSMFLHLHPDGASLDYLWSYVHTREPALQPCDVEVLLSKFPTLFPLEVTGVGATLERRWKFGGFAPSL